MAGPARPSTSRDVAQFLNGAPVFLGALVSAGAAVNNLTTANPFNSAALGPSSIPGFPMNYSGTLAGKMLLLQTTAAGLMLPSVSSAISIAAQTSPPASNTQPGVLLGANERVIILMMPNMGWLQWLPSTGAANLFVWELL